MKAIMLMFDSLNRKMLPPYGGEYVQAPNFTRLAEKTVVFSNFYVGSMPCMPARRELHTGRYNFLHRSWGPMEAFDFSTPEFLKKNGVYTHIVTDHQHYWEDGGEGYLTRYNTFECVRGQEGDPWIGQVDRHEEEETLRKIQPVFGSTPIKVQDQVNRKSMPREEDHTHYRVHRGGIDFIQRNKDADNWFLQIEHFDPHEPFFVPKKYKNLYEDGGYTGEEFDWPEYKVVTEDAKKTHRARQNYSALVSMCDRYLGELLDIMDEYGMWNDTMLIVNTDHGFLLGEHEWWGKNCMPMYNEIVNTPFFIWDPRCKKKGETRDALAQTIDIAPTLLEYFGLPLDANMNGRPLNRTVERDESIRDAALFGYHGGHINVTDGKWVYMRAGANPENIYQYTLAATHLRRFFLPEELATVELFEGFAFTQNNPVMKIRRAANPPFSHTADTSYFGHKLYDLTSDPDQKHPVNDPAVELAMIEKMAALMRENEAPPEQFRRVGIPFDGKIAPEILEREKAARKEKLRFGNVIWEHNVDNEYLSMIEALPPDERATVIARFESYIRGNKVTRISSSLLFDFVVAEIPESDKQKVFYFCEIAGRR